MAIIKNVIYFIKLIPVNPVVNHIGKCHNPHQNPIIIDDSIGEFFFWSSFKANPLQPNSSPNGPANKFFKNKYINIPNDEIVSLGIIPLFLHIIINNTNAAIKVYTLIATNIIVNFNLFLNLSFTYAIKLCSG